MNLMQPSSVLVVDDEPVGFTVIQAFLKSEGYDLHYLASGAAVLNQIDAIAPDLILLDAMMPELDGLEVCRTLKADPIWTHIPIIMVTALNSNEDLARCFTAGANDFIAKPINRLELKARVNSMLQIKHQQDALKATMQLREDMSAMMVHDLRNPLTSILLGTQFVLMQGSLSPPHRERLELVYASSQRLNSMVNELLLMAKMSAGQLHLNLTAVDLKALADNVLSEFHKIFEAKHLALETTLPPSGHTIAADAHLLHRLLDNLLSNAIKFSPPGGKITLSIHTVHPNDQQPTKRTTIIQVIDEGPGIEAGMQTKIFDKYQIGNDPRDVSQTGLGLTFCKMVTDAHGGRIYFANHQPTGSIFTVEI